MRISDDCVLFAGGVNDIMKKISNKTFIYDLRTKKIEKLPSMIYPKFKFTSELLENSVYAIGGRSYGTNEISILKIC